VPKRITFGENVKKKLKYAWLVRIHND